MSVKDWEAKVLTALRERAGMTQRELADTSNELSNENRTRGVVPRPVLSLSVQFHQ